MSNKTPGARRCRRRRRRRTRWRVTTVCKQLRRQPSHLVLQKSLQLRSLAFVQLLPRESNVQAQPQVSLLSGLAVGHACSREELEGGDGWDARDKMGTVGGHEIARQEGQHMLNAGASTRGEAPQLVAPVLPFHSLESRCPLLQATLAPA